jgi:hypothetical protein
MYFVKITQPYIENLKWEIQNFSITSTLFQPVHTVSFSCYNPFVEFTTGIASQQSSIDLLGLPIYFVVQSVDNKRVYENTFIIDEVAQGSDGTWDFSARDYRSILVDNATPIRFKAPEKSLFTTVINQLINPLGLSVQPGSYSSSRLLLADYLDVEDEDYSGFKTEQKIAETTSSIYQTINQLAAKQGLRLAPGFFGFNFNQWETRGTIDFVKPLRFNESKLVFDESNILNPRTVRNYSQIPTKFESSTKTTLTKIKPIKTIASDRMIPTSKFQENMMKMNAEAARRDVVHKQRLEISGLDVRTTGPESASKPSYIEVVAKFLNDADFKSVGGLSTRLDDVSRWTQQSEIVRYANNMANRGIIKQNSASFGQAKNEKELENLHKRAISNFTRNAFRFEFEVQGFENNNHTILSDQVVKVKYPKHGIDGFFYVEQVQYEYSETGAITRLVVISPEAIEILD